MDDLNASQLIKEIGHKRKRISLVSFLVAIIVSVSCYFFVFNKFHSQLRFYITASGTANYNTILEQDFVDISVNLSEIKRIQSFAYSNNLAKLVCDSLQSLSLQTTPSCCQSSEDYYQLIKYYQVDISHLNEIEVHSKHPDLEMAKKLSSLIMFFINQLNNDFLASFKHDQIKAREGQIALLEENKAKLKSKIQELSIQIKAYGQSKEVEEALIRINNPSLGQSSTLSLMELLLNKHQPEIRELELVIDRLNSINNEIENEFRNLRNDQLSMELIKSKQAYLTQEITPKNRQSAFNVIWLLLVSFIICVFLQVLLIAINQRYKQYFQFFSSPK